MAAGGSNEPNLTPFIDLFSVLICFLLMTAAWVQLESVSVQVEKTPAPSDSADPSPVPEKPPEKKTKLTVFVYPEKVVMKEDEKEVEVVNRAGGWDRDRLKSILADWHVRFPDKKDIVLNTEAKVTYGQLIKMYDLLVLNDWTDVGINPN